LVRKISIAFCSFKSIENAKDRLSGQPGALNLNDSDNQLDIHSSKLTLSNTEYNKNPSASDSPNPNNALLADNVSTSTAAVDSKHCKKTEYKLRTLLEFLYNSKLKSNFYSFIISLLLIHFWILSTYLTGYLFSPTVYSILIGHGNKLSPEDNKHYSDLSTLVEILSAIVGGFGTALFFKNIILSLFESSHFLNRFRHLTLPSSGCSAPNNNTNLHKTMTEINEGLQKFNIDNQKLSSKFYFMLFSIFSKKN
jgi:hypothetical protein